MPQVTTRIRRSQEPAPLPDSEVDVAAINMKTGNVLLEDGQMIPIVSYHNEDEDEVDPSEATFVTFQWPDGGWGVVLLSDLTAKMH